MNNHVPAIAVENLVKRYPVFGGFRQFFRHLLKKYYRTALDGVSLEVEQGRCFCLLGPNGAGKTTLIKILIGLILPDGGRALVNGHVVGDFSAGAKAAVGYAVNDERSFYWRLTGRQNLAFFGSLNNLHGPDLDRAIHRVLRLTNLESAADLRFNAYSSGMRQMLSFARALLTEAKVLFVDEPTRSLDPRAAASVRTFLREELARNHGRTVFWATHNLAEAMEVADEIAIIDRGRLRIIGDKAELTGAGRIPLQQVYDAAVEAQNNPTPVLREKKKGEGH